MKKPISNIAKIAGVLVFIFIAYQAFDFYKFLKKDNLEKEQAENLKELKQDVKTSCIGEYKAVINLYNAWFNTIPVSLEGMIKELESLEKYDSNYFDITRECFSSTPTEYERRMDGGGYRLIYDDAWGDEQIEVVDFEKEYK